ncbi:MAG: type II secretion system F family protein [Sedimentisphaerales bacterium]|jgi:type II secretory pathway component PulF|nr:type II secretion system F family protein [Sedimentisphaerales bacterium]HNY80828.1 type II secretion system F family protein [Sedimentisphaerales bacterium]HOC65586.1 type II secretion system F family protein [Sedimentisphaerales bacterium]HOH66719.1 type II secretion system F family protein [Sedimentisphaerales bacterium]HPY48926.1 type II secretion system F family protein [Sedimentisphaerales bacterium]
MALQTVQEHENHAAASEDWQSTKSQATGSSRRSHSQAESYAAPNSLVGKMKGFRIEFGPSRKDILHFTSQLAVMVRAGISLQDALEGICEQSDNAKFQGVLRDLKLRIEEGNSFSQALAEHPQVFTNLYVNMVAAAEASGSLSDMLQKLAEYLDQEAETRSQVKGAMVYPVIIAAMAIGVTTFLLCFVLPRFTAIFQGKEHLLPAPTIVLMATSHFLRTRWYLIIPVIGAAFWALHYFINTPTGRLWWDKAKLVLPLIRTLCRSLYITRSLHTMGVLTRAGVPILNTLSITAHISGNVLFKDMWLGVYEEVRQGKKIAASLARYTLMPSSVVQMIRSGEDSGNMAEVLRDVSGFYARELKAVIKAVTSMIEPIMICLMGVLVGFIAMSIILPIFKMSSLVSGK